MDTKGKWTSRSAKVFILLIPLVVVSALIVLVPPVSEVFKDSANPVTVWQHPRPYPKDPQLVLDISLAITGIDSAQSQYALTRSIAASSSLPIVAAIGVEFPSAAFCYQIQFKPASRAGVWYESSTPMSLPITSQITETAPFDYYELGRMFIAVNGSAFVNRVTLSSQALLGYTGSIRDVEEYSSPQLSSLPPLFQGFANYDYCFAISIVVVRNVSEIVLDCVYLLSMSYFVYLVALLARRVDELKDWIKIYVGVTFAVVGFMWGLRQVFPRGITYWELLVLLFVLAWGVITYGKSPPGGKSFNADLDFRC